MKQGGSQNENSQKLISNEKLAGFNNQLDVGVRFGKRWKNFYFRYEFKVVYINMEISSRQLERGLRAQKTYIHKM